ncbi:carbamoyltransferase [Sinosporangium album]|uniref:Carbamoyltransferase n=1 Tax=Sinosporangium album TaxID=504805 RepID=A0A1G7XIN9_9ACTN|nr:carbamoyltransferase C-terminal domain-containing protein [Sinosporangium album]SDG84109.1 carbamoyltransferase [Sinosporangium album]
MNPLTSIPSHRSHAVLGLCSYTHDSAAALLIDGKLEGFVEEERLSEVKHTRAYPEQAVAWLLREAHLLPEQVDVVAYNFHGSLYFGDLAALPLHLGSGPALERARSFAKVGLRTMRRVRGLQSEFPNARVRPVRHHHTHQLYAFAASGWDRSAVLIVDSLGETQTTTIAAASCAGGGGPALKQVLTLRDPASLGYAYGAVTEHLGWRRGDEEGTVMALAALGDPARFRELFERIIPITAHGFTLHPAYFALRVLSSGHKRLRPAFAEATCLPRRPEEPLTEVHRDLAAALQEHTNQVMLHLARLAQRRTGERRLCVGGGVATNCVSIGKIIEAGVFDEVFVPPAPGDAGTAIGAAAAAHLEVSSLPLTGLTRCYLGPEYPAASIDMVRWPSLVEKPVDGDAADFLADQLAAGLIVGLFHGRVEAGPRALGNRSILASPLRSDVVEKLNAVVKFREPFRPFAPMALAEHAADYFTLDQQAPFMSTASGVTDLARTLIPAIVHANGTARLQTVTQVDNPFVHAVLAAFARRTGVPVLINTSLNVKGKPICGTPAMALDCLAESGLDALMLEERWFTK